MRIGISTGCMVIGNMGTERRFDYPQWVMR
jgi:class 3 adenylate cyclase